MPTLEERAKSVLLANYEATGRKYICPSWPHYPHQWVWDSCFHAIVCSYLGLLDLARNEIERLFQFQDEKGFIPHLVYLQKFDWRRIADWKDWERFFYKGWLPPHTSLVGVPVLAQAVRAIGDAQFFSKHVDQIIKFYGYFDQCRDLDRDGLISIINPRESGRDSSPEFDFFRVIQPYKSFEFLNAAVEIASLALLEIRAKMKKWDEQKIFESKLFDVQDLATQCIFLDGMYDLLWMIENYLPADLFFQRQTEVRYFEQIIRSGEQAILDKCWNEEDRTFYSTRNGSIQLRDLTVASLFPLLMKNLPDRYKDEIILALRDEKKFNTPYPIPSVGVDHPKFNIMRTWPLWRGPTWINTNWFIIRGLLQYGELELARNIARKSVAMVEKGGFREFYNPYTGDGMRVKNFGWSTLAVTFPSLLKNFG